MMAGNPNWWSMNDMHPQPPQHYHQQHLSSSSLTNYLSPPSSSSSTSHFQHLFGSSSPLLASTPQTPLDDHHPNNPEFPRSWSQLLMSPGTSHFQYNWFQNSSGGGEDEEQQQQQVFNNNSPCLRIIPPIISCSSSDNNLVKQEEVVNSTAQSNTQLYGRLVNNEEYMRPCFMRPPLPLPPQAHQLNLPSSSPMSCLTSPSSGSNLLNFSTTSTLIKPPQAKTSDHSSTDQGNRSPISSGGGGGLAKKPRVQQSSSQPALKVRKEKLGDRITALHQIVSPFGKTDTASVLSEAIGYIRFLLGQIEALSTPYMGNASKSMVMGHPQHSIQETNCLFTEDPGQLLGNNCLQRRDVPTKQEGQSRRRDLRSRGLCLVPISCTQHVGSENGADYWAPALGGGGF